MIRLTELPPDSFRRTPWKNGGGVAIDIDGAYRPDAVPGDWSGIIWRFGRTAITVGAPFSNLAGYERLQLVVEGAGLVLETPDGELDLRRPLVPVRYDGGTPIVSRLESGPVEVVNLIADRASCAIDLRVPGQDRPLSLPEGTHVLYAPREAIAASLGGRPVSIPGGHALRVEASPAVELTLTGGTALVASIRPLAG